MFLDRTSHTGRLDKSTRQWRSSPLLVKIGMLGLSTKKQAHFLEMASIILGLHGLIFFCFTTSLAHLSTILFFFGAYWLSAACRYIDNHQLWGEPPAPSASDDSPNPVEQSKT